VQAYPTIRCDSPGYDTIATVAGIIGAIYVLVPLALAQVFGPRLLSVSKHGINADYSAIDGKMSASALYVLGALTAPYRKHAALWKLFVVLRRLALVIAVVFVTDRGWRMVAASLLNLAVLLSHMFVRPYKHWIDNLMETLSLSSLVLLTTMLVQVQPPYTDADNQLITILWVIPSVILLVWAVIGSVLSKVISRKVSNHQTHQPNPPSIGEEQSGARSQIELVQATS
jgi:hypothetical protein